METRKVQITGGSTYTVSLPKGWTRENDVTDRSTIAIYTDENNLILAPHDNDERIEGQVDVFTLDNDDIVRTIIAMYVNGFDIITLEMNRITPDTRRATRNITQNLVGLEVMEERKGKIVIRNLLNSAQLSICDSISRMQVIAVTMLEDAVTALTKNDDDLAREIVNRDDDIDRLWFVVSRLFRKTLRTPVTVEELGFSREVCFDFYTSARQLERIADHAAKIGQITTEVDEIPENVATPVDRLHGKADTVINTAMEAVFSDEQEHAVRLSNEALRTVLEVDEHSRGINELLRELDSHQAHQLRLCVDSLSRCADYGSNIAETALQKAAPRP
ncbi:phosphate signaling complex PhoU family protein [Haladaptatus halobius]|uniref:phosphate signaling complex PhoU family protein n=1 Tax=Haladaptatus halobius TaxID=2884875 RepID=UPI001D0BA126|nr:phosphate uptake regulator PhoU [Haladaptatus halobius]